MRVKFFILVTIMGLFSCQKMDEDDTTVMQLQRIEEYLESNNIDFVYRDNVYIEYLSDDIDKDAVGVSDGDSIYINYAAYTFYEDVDDLYATNIEEIALENSDVFESGDFTPLGFVYGVSDVIDGLYIALRNAKEGEILNIYMPSDMAYGDVLNGVVPQYSSIMFYVEVDKVLIND